MLRRPPRSTRSGQRFPYTALVLSLVLDGEPRALDRGVVPLQGDRGDRPDGAAHDGGPLAPRFRGRRQPPFRTLLPHHERSAGAAHGGDRHFRGGEALLRRWASVLAGRLDFRSEARRVGKEGVSTCRYRWWLYN